MLRYLISMTEYFKAGHYLDQHENKLEEHILDVLDQESGYLSQDQLELRYPSREFEPLADELDQRVESRSESGEPIYKAKDIDSVKGPEGMESLIVSTLDVDEETRKEIRKEARDMSSDEIKAEQDEIYGEMKRQADEVARKLDMSPGGFHGVSGFLSPLTAREMYREPDAPEIPKGFETLDFNAPYEQLLSQVEQLNMDLLSQEEKMQLVRLLELKAAGGDPNLI